MRIKELIKTIGLHPRIQDFEVEGITCDSRDVRDNYIFVAIKGAACDGHQFIGEAAKRGAKAIIIQGQRSAAQSTGNTPFIVVDDTRQVLARLAAEFYGRPSSKLKVVGVTGTNGKTTITYLLEALLKEAGFQPAVIGTINYRFKNKVIPSKNTTPGPVELQSMLAEMLDEGMDYAVMEVSSHALDQDRTTAIDFHSAIFTNLTQDHLDYHGTLENYFRAKSGLFTDINPASFVILNKDDEYSRRLERLTPARVITYGIDNNADITAKDIRFDISHTEFSLVASKGATHIKVGLIGRHNVYNILAASAWGISEGIGLPILKSALEKFCQVPGRLERISLNSRLSVFVDYAHTEDALRNAINALRPLTKSKIIVVFGCGGERDKDKRPKMGRVVCDLADFAFITSDNPRCEDPEDIINEIKAGIRKDNYSVIPDRRQAIGAALKMAGSDDIVLVAGKGHENYQILKDKRISFDDREVVRECLRSMNY